MRARQWFMGVAGAGAFLGLMASGCGSSGNSTTSDASAEAGDGGEEAACMPEAVNATDSGACTACVATMCNSELMACNADCTCGNAVNMLGSCLSMVPSPAADASGGGFGAFLGPGGLALLACFMPLLPAGGIPGFGGGGGGAGAVSPATQSFAQCLLTSCSAQCVAAAPEGGATDGGSSEASVQDAPAGDANSNDAGGDAGSDGGTGGGADASNGDGSSDGSPESAPPDGSSEAGD